MVTNILQILYTYLTKTIYFYSISMLCFYYDLSCFDLLAGLTGLLGQAVVNKFLKKLKLKLKTKL